MRTEIIDNDEAMIKRVSMQRDKIDVEFLFREGKDLIIFREFGFKVTKILSVNHHIFYENPGWFSNFWRCLTYLPKICMEA
ncbi:MAG: hypothetical protein AMQ22_00027 [Candidatus Methanofastidiosum methylothiophilum]|uniref:Uncharacterized protein n=1 Tax=Candidatus Methanofastidiosum methylothiophilum TaxID=1705564 RepID=A0A150J9S2_9EURY|nr:MAG: hypothetical protein AMQ22_00027 [Candidatus Methanofastidiosum methylthiophilus]